MQEHYGLSIAASSARKITERHAHSMRELENTVLHHNQVSKPILLAETDGSMIPIVNSVPQDLLSDYDKRKYKMHSWKEARLSLVRAIGSTSPIFAATMDSVQTVSQQLKTCAKRIGYDKRTQVHCVGDGALWIAQQVEEAFGSQAKYLVDFYHVCEYLAKAAPACGSMESYLSRNKEYLKKGELSKTLGELKRHMEPLESEEADAPVRQCYRYLNNRKHQLDYADALAKGLPIGSGEIESAHRYVIQKRLKIPGAWWNKEKAQDMLALRVVRANKDWESYWMSRKRLAH
jgi:hypothetical protein